jgi:hypothetical protein
MTRPIPATAYCTCNVGPAAAVRLHSPGCDVHLAQIKVRQGRGHELPPPSGYHGAHRAEDRR